MKKQILILSAFLISMTVFGQKDELKSAEKAIAANDFATALTQVEKAEALISDADQKTTAKYYYLKAMALYQNGSSSADGMAVSKAFNDVVTYEKESGKQKYTNEINGLTQTLIQATATKASAAYKNATVTNEDGDFAKAAEQFHLVYLLSPKDTLYLDNAALIYNKAKDFETSSKLYNELLAINYTGISKEFIATSIADGQDVSYPDKKAMDLQVKLKLASNPRVEMKESRRNIIFKYLAENYVALEDNDKALEVLATGRKEYPDSYELLIAEANVYYKKGNKDMFKQLLQEAISLNPTNSSLYYNVGVMNMEQKNTEEAIKNFEKAIELDPEFAAAYQNIGTAIIDKTLPIVEEMNKSLNDFDKYDRLLAEQKEIYKEALPYYEKAYELDGTNIGVIQTLLGLYENLEMTEKLEALQVVYEQVKE